MAALDDNNSLLLFRVGPVRCCAPSLPVESIITPPALTHPPGSNIARPGIFKHGKQLVSVMELRYLFGVNKEDWKPGRNIITRIENRFIGFWVDEILDVIEMPGKGWGKVPTLIPQDIFSRTLLLDEHIFLYAEFENLAKIRHPGILKKYIEQLTEQQTNKTTSTGTSKTSSDSGDVSIIEGKNINSPVATEPENHMLVTEASTEKNETCNKNKLKPDTIFPSERDLQSTQNKAQLKHSCEPQTQDSAPKTQLNTSSTQNNKSNRLQHRANLKSEYYTVSVLTNDKPVVTVKNSLNSNRDLNRKHIDVRHIEPGHKIKTIPHSSNVNKRKEDSPQNQKEVEHNASIKSRAKSTSRSNTIQHEDNNSAWLVMFVLLVLLSGTGYFIYDQYFTLNKQSKKTAQYQPKKYISTYPQQSKLPADLKTENDYFQEAQGAQNFYSNETNEANKSLANQADNSSGAEFIEEKSYSSVNQYADNSNDIKIGNETVKSVLTEVKKNAIIESENNLALKSEENDTNITGPNRSPEGGSPESESPNNGSPEKETSEITENILPIDGQTLSIDPPLVQDDPLYRAEIARKGNDITIVLHDTDITGTNNEPSFEQTDSIPVSNESSNPQESAEQSNIEPLVTSDTPIQRESSPQNILGNNEAIKSEALIEIDIQLKLDIEKEKSPNNANQGENSKFANSSKTEIVHIVVKGDTLWAIAKRYVNNPFRYPELARLSRIKNPDLIYPGNRVRIIKILKK